MHTQADIKTTQNYLDYQPTVTLAKGIKKYIPEIKHIHENLIND